MDTKVIKTLAFAAVVVAGIGTASADESDTLPIWEGFYGGFGVGYGWSEGSVGIEGLTTGTGVFDDSINIDGESALSSIHLGYMKQSGNFVVGGQLTGILSEYDGGANTDFNVNNLTGPNGKGEFSGLFVVGDDEFATETSGMFTATGRVGFARDNTLFYATGGLASAEISTSFSSSATGGICIPFGGLGNCNVNNGFDPDNPATVLSAGASASGQTSKRHYGFVVGGGFEHKVNEFLSMGVEYTYTKLQAKTHSASLEGDIQAFEDFDVFDFDGDYNVRVDPNGLHSVKATVSIHFN